MLRLFKKSPPRWHTAKAPAKFAGPPPGDRPSPPATDLMLPAAESRRAPGQTAIPGAPGDLPPTKLVQAERTPSHLVANNGRTSIRLLIRNGYLLLMRAAIGDRLAPRAATMQDSHGGNKRPRKSTKL